MNQKEAMELMGKLLTGLQRARSIGNESFKDSKLSEVGKIAALEYLNPWLYGIKGDAYISGVVKVVNRGSIEPIEFYNFMTILSRDLAMKAMVEILCDTDFPLPDFEWFKELKK